MNIRQLGTVLDIHISTLHNQIELRAAGIDPVISNVRVNRPDPNVYEFSESVNEKSKKTFELARFHYLQGVLSSHTNFINL